jgi:hypothetical protein
MFMTVYFPEEILAFNCSISAAVSSRPSAPKTFAEGGTSS